MRICNTIDETRAAVTEARAAGKTVGLVPTMGALHEGHFSLVDAARQRCDAVVVSIFVNPTQFGPGEDLDAYPRTLDADAAGCRERGVDVVFAPSVAEMYPDGPGGGLTTVSVARLPETLCGRRRPGHFAGVCTVVSKLLNIVQPDVAFFGEKDFQQATIIRRMVRDLDMPVEIVVCPTVREADGLAMSSRNAYLSAADRAQAVALSGALRLARRLVAASQPPVREVVGAMRDYLGEHAPAGEIDYVQIVDPDTLEDVEWTDRPCRALVAVRFGGARLIDNVALGAEVRGDPDLR